MKVLLKGAALLTLVILLYSGSAVGQSVTLSRVEGLDAGDQIPTGEEVTFYINLAFEGAQQIGMANGFRVYSPDGAEWTTTVADTLIPSLDTYYDLLHQILDYSADGSGADTVGFIMATMFGTGFPSDFDDEAYSVTIGPIDASHDGKQICMDSSFIPPSSSWIWTSGIPSWDGPHCYTIGSSCCDLRADVNGSDTGPDISDLVYLNSYMFQGGPEPSCLAEANIDGSDEDPLMINIADLLYLKNYMFSGGPAPVDCNSSTSYSPASGGAITLSSVSGLDGSDQIPTDGSTVTYNLNYNVDGNQIHGLTNAFRVYSPDGATWTDTEGETLVSSMTDYYDLLRQINNFSVNGSGADTVGFGLCTMFSTGFPTDHNTETFSVTVGPFSPDDAGKQICLDSSYYPPSGQWMWANSSASMYIPSWDGPHCYTIAGSGNDELTCGDIITGTLAVGETVEYDFDATVGDAFTIRMSVDGVTVDPWIRLYDPDGLPVTSDYSTAYKASIVAYVAEKSGTYTINVADHSGTQAGDYHLSLECVNNCDTYPTVSCGDIVSGDLIPGESDAYCFEALSGDAVTIYMSVDGASVDPFLELYDPDGI